MYTGVFVVNKFLMNDPVLKVLFSPKTPQPFVGYAPESLDDSNTFPYIRYIHVPAFDRRTPKMRRDIVQYYIGDKDFENLTRILERLILILNADDNYENYKINDPDGNILIKESVYLGGAPEVIPNQDEGVWEQGATFQITYSVKKRQYMQVYGLDSKLI